MAIETVALEDIKKQPLEGFLREIAGKRGQFVVQMPDGAKVLGELRPRLEPLPELEGSIPLDWRDAVYARE